MRLWNFFKEVGIHLGKAFSSNLKTSKIKQFPPVLTMLVTLLDFSKICILYFITMKQVYSVALVK